ncbi:hypothetical protein BKA62DRAFT_729891 [Auriculariales sp. MPI-PUGE-AT-0066]|nr:hypothetical protein BKA62DRAFT_729891 [Auriculariales sp. MPI-PUGE-AT-0066]
MGDIALQLIATAWVPNAQGYNGLFDFSHCPKPELVQAIGNDTSQLQSFDHLVQHTLPLPTEMDAWSLTTAFQLFGVVVYNDGALVSSTSRTINAVWNGKQVAAQVWSAVPGNPCVYFEFQVDDPGTTVPTGDDPCNPPVAKLSFAGTDAPRSDFEMVVSSAFLVGQSRPISPPEPLYPGRRHLKGRPRTLVSQAMSYFNSRICTRDLPADTRKSAPTSVTPAATSFPSASDSETPADQQSPYTSGSSTSTMPTATSISRSTTSIPTTATTTSTPSGEPNRQTTTAAVGIAVGSAALFILLLSVVLIRRRTQRRRREKEFLAPYDRETAVPPNQEPKRRFEEKIEGQTERRADTGVEDIGFRDFYSAMRRAGLTVQSLLEHHSGPSDRSPDRLPDYTAR